MKLFQPSYFAPIAQYAAMFGEDKILFECEDNYQKQTYRNRCYIAAANGKLLLNIPIKHKTNSRKTKDILVDYSDSLWHDTHLKSMQAAYRSSPFYEYYEADIISIFERKHRFLIDLNIATHVFVINALQENVRSIKTEEYETETLNEDFRWLVNAKKRLNWNFNIYTQMFDHKNGFYKNLSILDLLFMEGPASFSYLQSHKPQNEQRKISL